MIDYNEDYEYAQDKLLGTVVRLKNGSPVYVCDVEAVGQVCCVKTLVGNNKKLNVKLKDLNVSSPPLGFVNYRNDAFYVMRIPKRRDWHQGIRSANCIVGGGGFVLDHILGSSLNNCILGVYPTLDSVLERFTKAGNKAIKIAWNRHWALTHKSEFVYKNWGAVGMVDGDGIKFYDGFSFLRESFEEAIK